MTALVTIRDAWPLHASALDLTCQAVVLTVHMATAAANRDNVRALRLAAVARDFFDRSGAVIQFDRLARAR